MEKLKGVLTSRKFWGGVAGLAFLYFGSRAGVSEDLLKEGVLIVVTYIGGVALEGLRAK